MEEMVIIYITNPSVESVEELAKHLLKKRLIACANIFTGNSMYWSEGEITKEGEFVLIAKTVEDNFSAVRHEISEVHDYQIPCIIKFSATANQQFVQWIRGEVRI